MKEIKWLEDNRIQIAPPAKTPKITGKGQLYFTNLFLNHGKEMENERSNHRVYSKL